uniref:Uncharacterized protein n=1 Tax=Oryzias melastigma TaxID=30732 RepID=A0A3B3DEZ3_ORYME
MGDSQHFKASAIVDLLDNLGHTLTGKSERLLSDYQSPIHSLRTAEMETILKDLATEALTKTLRNKFLTEMSDHLAAKETECFPKEPHLLSQIQGNSDSHLQKIINLQEENKFLKLQLEMSERHKTQADPNLTELTAHISRLKEEDSHFQNECKNLNMQFHARDTVILTLHRQITEMNVVQKDSQSVIQSVLQSLEELEQENKAFEKQLEAKEEHIQLLQEQLALAKNKLGKANNRCETLAKELVAVRKELKQPFQIEHTQPHPSHEEDAEFFTVESFCCGSNLQSCPPASWSQFQKHEACLDSCEPDLASLALDRSSAPSYKELDKIARNIYRFEPIPGGSNDICSYLNDIDFYLRRFPNVTTEDRIYLIKVTSSREVGKFIERQTELVRNDFQFLRQALEKEFSDHASQSGLTVTMTVKQGRHEHPQAYYYRLLRAYFGVRNEPVMEEDLNSKTLFIQNLHSDTSQQLGVFANPKSTTVQGLRKLASMAYHRQEELSRKSSDTAAVLAANTESVSVKLEGVSCTQAGNSSPQQQLDKSSSNFESRHFNQNLGQPKTFMSELTKDQTLTERTKHTAYAKKHPRDEFLPYQYHRPLGPNNRHGVKNGSQSSSCRVPRKRRLKVKPDILKPEACDDQDTVSLSADEIDHLKTILKGSGK